VVAGLLRPYEYAKEFVSESGIGKEKGKGRAMWELPDTNILFRRYLDSGRMINVFDWFESFKGVLEVQRRGGLLEVGGGEAEEVGKRGVSRSPRKKGGKGRERKLKGKEVEKEKEQEEEVMGEGEGEEWKLEVQARFIRALHELDYLGFVKHTGRKRDHVMRTVFEVGDEEEDGD
jgi:origin recognition complex subunit 3